MSGFEIIWLVVAALLLCLSLVCWLSPKFNYDDVTFWAAILTLVLGIAISILSSITIYDHVRAVDAQQEFEERTDIRIKYVESRDKVITYFDADGKLCTRKYVIHPYPQREVYEWASNSQPKCVVLAPSQTQYPTTLVPKSR